MGFGLDDTRNSFVSHWNNSHLRLKQQQSSFKYHEASPPQKTLNAIKVEKMAAIKASFESQVEKLLWAFFWIDEISWEGIC